MVECWLCSRMFEPKPETLHALAEAGQGIHDALLDCPDCERLQERIRDHANAGEIDSIGLVIPGNIAG